jgi:glycosyltransferase involved in cell wall biosynthesis
MGQRLLEDYEQLGIRRIIELDDLVTEVPASNAHAREVPRDIERWVRRAFERCERAIVSTEPLAEAVRRWRPDVRVVANRLPEAWRHLAPVRAHERRRPRVGWAGGIGHDGDLALLRQVLAPLSDEIDFVLFGLCPKALRPFVREFYPGVPFDRYPQALAALDLDVALAPLEVNRFNECKSNLRLLEYGALGWPVIATDIAPYRGTLPVTRVKNTTAAWVEAIRALAFDRDAAHAAGEQLRAAVLREGMLADHLDGWHAALFDARLDAPVDAPPVTTPRATLNTTQEHADVGA